MNIYDIRRINVWHLVHPQGYTSQGVKAFAEKIGKTEQRVRHFVAKNPLDKPVKTIGDRVAREIEQVMDLREGWLDLPHRAHQKLWEQAAGYRLDVQEMSTAHTKPAPVQPEGEMDTLLELENLLELSGRSAGALIRQGRVLEVAHTESWAAAHIPAHSSREKLRIITASTDEMAGLICAGDIVLIDCGYNTVDADGIYFFRLGDATYMRILQNIPGLGLQAKAANTNYDAWTISDGMDIEIIGRAIKIWSGRDI